MLGIFFATQTKASFHVINTMVLGPASTDITFVPFVSFEGLTNVTVEVWHKLTNVKDTALVAVVQSGSKITLALPALTNVTAKATNLDKVLVRVLDGTALVWAYLGTWSDSSTNNSKVFKDFKEPSAPQQQWMKA